VKISKELRVGFVVVSGLFLLIYGLNFLKGKNLFSGRTYYHVMYDNVGGLTESNPVFYRGLVVGKVNTIEILESNGKLLVEFALTERDLKIPNNTVASIFSDGLLGTKAINLLFGDSKVMAESGDTLLPDLQSSITEEVTKQVLPIKEKAEKLIVTVDSLIQSITLIFSTKSKNNLQHTLENMDNISSDFSGIVVDQKVRLRNISSNIESISKNLKDNNEALTGVIRNMKSITDSIAAANLVQTINQTNMAIKQTSEVLAKINSGKGSMGMLLNNDSLYNNLEASSKNLDRLLEDMRLHPNRYVHFSVFGKKEKSDKKSKSKK
jgi:phospholipid/cholesterol/gamma-HCH transport system substrate-binding protein